MMMMTSTRRQKLRIIYYVIPNGRRKTPLHTLNGIAVHDACRNSLLIKSLNHLGCCISYDEVLRIRKDLATYTVQSCETNVPSVLFQKKSSVTKTKLKISKTNVSHRSRSFTFKLKCQRIRDYDQPSKIINLPHEYTTNESPNSYDAKQKNLKEMLWILCRLKSISSEQEKYFWRKWTFEFVCISGRMIMFVGNDKINSFWHYLTVKRFNSCFIVLAIKIAEIKLNLTN